MDQIHSLEKGPDSSLRILHNAGDGMNRQEMACK